MDVELEAYTERSVRLLAAPEVVARYFAQNEQLLAKLVGPERVERLGPGLYRVATRGFRALGLSVTPAFEVAFVDYPEVTHMASKACHLLSSSSYDLDLEARFEGEAQFHHDPDGTALFCWTETHARIRLPQILRLSPVGVVKGVLESLMKGALEALSSRFVPVIQEDFAAWQRQQGLEAPAPDALL